MTEESSRAEQVRCPICGAPAAPAVRPFCSRRCADVDLGRWLSGAYAIPDTREGADDSIDVDGDEEGGREAG